MTTGRVEQRKRSMRQAKLDHIAQQIADGKLTIRKMTAAELKQWGPVKDAKAAAKRAKRKAYNDGL